jgi:hypothetical protein
LRQSGDGEGEEKGEKGGRRLHGERLLNPETKNGLRFRAWYFLKHDTYFTQIHRIAIK